ncbi:WGxxGxxG family protein [Paenibacillus sp. JX-17]|uniref:WGxxGxxG family protein n=1 Tax=Paenibacillus lacisoli TaxID=3064525 RepID=A0ABT9CEV4_9BACL|nr:WGxxGxxG family protein [Paenibacillus sp. JX-17]MDO7906133.1 WGxxGxxG family protein [Paenibacillus sp. JX-17]
MIAKVKALGAAMLIVSSIAASAAFADPAQEASGANRNTATHNTAYTNDNTVTPYSTAGNNDNRTDWGWLGLLGLIGLAGLRNRNHEAHK